MKIDSLYVHIPFCEHICGYCDFTKLIYNEDFSHRYIVKLISEINSYKIKKLKTIYIGGGTPTSISDVDFSFLLSNLYKYIDFNSSYEFTVEANVENLTKNKLELMKKYGVNRLSIGVESTNNRILKLINRHHTFKDVKEVIKLAKKMGFNNINVDLIYGLPTSNKEELKYDLANLVLLEVPHISIYSLTLSKGTLFYNKGIEPLGEEEDEIQYDLICEFLNKCGYKQYEISNFSLGGYESKHNKTYWKDKNYYGVGLGASGYIGDIRYQNTKNLNNYLNGEYIASKETLTKQEQILEYIMLNLRMNEGFKLEDFKNRFDIDFLEEFKIEADKFINEELLINDNINIKPTHSGQKLLDYMLRKFFAHEFKK